jgi:predicted nuclease of predicted toxin-antitoxin system
MLSLVIDEHVPSDLIRAAVAVAASQGCALDLVTVREVGLAHTPDQRILEWAASEGRVVVTSDVNTLVGFAYDRVRTGLPMTGVLVLRREVGTKACIESLTMTACIREPDEMTDRVRYLPGDD